MNTRILDLAIREKNYWIVSISDDELIYHIPTNFHKSCRVFTLGNNEFLIANKNSGSISKINISTNLEIEQTFFALLGDSILDELKVDAKMFFASSSNNFEHVIIYEYDPKKNSLRSYDIVNLKKTVGINLFVSNESLYVFTLTNCMEIFEVDLEHPNSQLKGILLPNIGYHNPEILKVSCNSKFLSVLWMDKNRAGYGKFLTTYYMNNPAKYFLLSEKFDVFSHDPALSDWYRKQGFIESALTSWIDFIVLDNTNALVILSENSNFSIFDPRFGILDYDGNPSVGWSSEGSKPNLEELLGLMDTKKRMLSYLDGTLISLRKAGINEEVQDNDRFLVEIMKDGSSQETLFDLNTLIRNDDDIYERSQYALKGWKNTASDSYTQIDFSETYTDDDTCGACGESPCLCSDREQSSTTNEF